MSEVIDVGGTTIRVTPVNELPFPESVTAGLISSRLISKIETADSGAIGAEDDLYELLELCVEDEIQRETIESLGPYELNAIIGTVFEPETDDENDDEDEDDGGEE